MTVIEFFACSPIENMVSCFLLKPDKVIFVCDGRRSKKRIEVYKKLALRMNYATEFVILPVQLTSINSIVDSLTDIVNNEDDCIFDLTGGNELALVAMGIVYERFKYTKKLQMQKYNFNSHKMIDCDGDGKVLFPPKNFNLNVHENIELHYGSVTSSTSIDMVRDGQDVDALWDICKHNPLFWNKSVGKLSELLRLCQYKDGGLTAEFVYDDMLRCYPNFNKVFDSVFPLFQALNKCGLITEIEQNRKLFRFAFKNHLVKRCLQKSGTVLELKVLKLVLGAKDFAGNQVFNDCASGVVMDWDGQTKKNGAEFDGTVNEIDVLIMRGLTPIFVSCKNGGVDESELYKLNAVSSRFGSKYSKKVLIASSLNKRGQGLKYFLERANDLGIVVIKDVHKLSDVEIINRIIKI